jgi:hypothetical protein
MFQYKIFNQQGYCSTKYSVSKIIPYKFFNQQGYYRHKIFSRQGYPVKVVREVVELAPTTHRVREGGSIGGIGTHGAPIAPFPKNDINDVSVVVVAILF